LGDNLSALVDGELTGADLDRANAHLAACERCRGDATALRALKSQLRGLAADAGHDDLMLRLLAMAGQSAAPLGGNDGDEGNRSSRRRHLVWGAVSLAVVGGLGAAAFSMGGGPSEPGPDVVPQVEMFSVQHASTTGDVPFPGPSPLVTRAATRQP
jgi:anti-sigma factor RsiW